MSNITSFHVTGDWRHIIDDGMVDVDALPDEALPTGHVIFTPLSPKVAVAGSPAVAHTLGEVKTLIAGGELTDLQGRAGVWLAGNIGDQVVRWRATTHLFYMGQKIAYPVLEFDLVDDAVLTGIIQNSEPGQPPIIVDPRIEALVREAQAALNETRTMLAEATEYHEDVEGWHSEIMPAAAQVAEDRQVAHDASALAVLAAAHAGRIMGAGSPEGAVDAPIGTIYVDTANGELWHKTTTEGSTLGWKRVGGGRRKRLLTASDNLDSLIYEADDGIYPVAPGSLAGILGLPGDSVDGFVDINWISGVASPTTIHLWVNRLGQIWTRTLRSGTFTPWGQDFPKVIKDYIDARASTGARVIPEGKTLDDLKFESDQATYRITSASQAVAVGFPEPSSPYSIVEVDWVAGSSTPAAYQVGRGYSGSVYRRIAKASQGWSSWIKDGSGTVEQPPLEKARTFGDPSINKSVWLRRNGGTIGTGGKAVVALRFDHNNRPFQDVILPLLKERGLPASQAQFVNALNMQPNYTNDDSDGLTWADIEENCVSGGVEVWNHSWSHANGELFHEIVESKAELERVMPKLAVRGMFRPGIPDGDWGGFNVSPFSDSLFYSTEAGRLVNQVHAACNGSGDVYWPLGTGAQFGFNHAGLDSVTATSSPIAIVNAAVQRGSGVIFMHHPNMLDYGAGYITTAVLTEFLDFLVAERDAGRIEILTVGGMLNADKTSTTRSDLIRNPTFQDSSLWSGSGWTRGGGQASTSGTNALSQVNANRWAEGGVRQLTVEGTAPAGARITVSASGTGLSVSKEFTFTSGVNVFRLPFTIPTGAGNVTVSAIGDGSAITLTRFSCLAT